MMPSVIVSFIIGTVMTSPTPAGPTRIHVGKVKVSLQLPLNILLEPTVVLLLIHLLLLLLV